MRYVTNDADTMRHFRMLRLDLNGRDPQVGLESGWHNDLFPLDDTILGLGGDIKHRSLHDDVRLNHPSGSIARLLMRFGRVEVHADHLDNPFKGRHFPGEVILLSVRW